MWHLLVTSSHLVHTLCVSVRNFLGHLRIGQFQPARRSKGLIWGVVSPCFAGCLPVGEPICITYGDGVVPDSFVDCVSPIGWFITFKNTYKKANIVNGHHVKRGSNDMCCNLWGCRKKKTDDEMICMNASYYFASLRCNHSSPAPSPLLQPYSSHHFQIQ